MAELAASLTEEQPILTGRWPPQPHTPLTDITSSLSLVSARTHRLFERSRFGGTRPMSVPDIGSCAPSRGHVQQIDKAPRCSEAAKGMEWSRPAGGTTARSCATGSSYWIDARVASWRAMLSCIQASGLNLARASEICWRTLVISMPTRPVPTLGCPTSSSRRPAPRPLQPEARQLATPRQGPGPNPECHDPKHGPQLAIHRHLDGRGPHLH
jgi:hypothetical protein